MDLHPNDDLGHLWKFRNSTLRTSRPSRSVEIDSRLVSISSVASFAFVWGRLASCLTTMQWTMNTGFSVSFRKMSWSLSWHILQRLHVSFEIGACPSFRKTLWMNVWKWSWILAMYMRTWSTTPIGWLLACPAGMALLQAQTLTSRQRRIDHDRASENAHEDIHQGVSHFKGWRYSRSCAVYPWSTNQVAVLSFCLGPLHHQTLSSTWSACFRETLGGLGFFGCSYAKTMQLLAYSVNAANFFIAYLIFGPRLMLLQNMTFCSSKGWFDS